MALLRITPSVAIDDGELQWQFVRASGPGGQNVNKVATAALLRFDAARSPSLPADVKRRLLALAGNRATEAGEIVIHAQRFRTQHQNRDDATKRLVALIHRATIVPKKRRKTKPSRAQKQRRLDDKRKRSNVKKLRRKDHGGD
ncbi:MAG: alternative ribosome rescue aminoacyl-tRNA hydrolase ArfB [Pseudomonadota bacterium]